MANTIPDLMAVIMIIHLKLIIALLFLLLFSLYLECDNVAYADVISGRNYVFNKSCSGSSPVLRKETASLSRFACLQFNCSAVTVKNARIAFAVWPPSLSWNGNGLHNVTGTK